MQMNGSVLQTSATYQFLKIYSYICLRKCSFFFFVIVDYSDKIYLWIMYIIKRKVELLKKDC